MRLASIAAVLFVLAGLLGFLTDEVKNSSKLSPDRIAQITGDASVPKSVDISQPNPSALVERLREAEHTSAREFIDDVGDVLMSPFNWIDSGGDAWVKRLIDGALALLVYGLLFQMLADWLRRSGDLVRRGAYNEQQRRLAEERRASRSFASPA